jgi:5-methylcytosine-specific restriction endonuclease McrA
MPGVNRAQVAARKAKVLGAIPKWADRRKIKVVYAAARRLGLQVDHIVPLRSNLVCGLHVWENLQLLSGDLNVRKGNREWPDSP